MRVSWLWLVPKVMTLEGGWNKNWTFGLQWQPVTLPKILKSWLCLFCLSSFFLCPALLCFVMLISYSTCAYRLNLYFVKYHTHELCNGYEFQNNSSFCWTDTIFLKPVFIQWYFVSVMKLFTHEELPKWLFLNGLQNNH